MESLDKFKNILDHIAGTAIYVIRKDNHKILYYNDRVKMITPHIAVGMVCNEIWVGTCDNCPLKTIGEKDYHTTVNYNDPFGAVVDISATKMIWDKNIQAYLIAVSPHVLTKEERRRELERNQFLTAIETIYPVAVSVNLTKNSYECLNHHLGIPVASFGRYDDFINEISALLHIDYRQKFINTFNHIAVMDSFAAGKNECRMEFKQSFSNQGVSWMMMRIIKVEDPFHLETAGVLLCSDIDEQKKSEETLLQALDTVSSNASGLYGKYLIKENNIYLIDASPDYLDYFGITMDERKQEAFSFLSKPEREKYITQFYSLAKNRETITAEFLYNQKKENTWLEFQASYINEQFGNPIYFGNIHDITERKQLELEREATYNMLPGGIAKIAIDNQFTLVDANETFYQLFTLDKEDFKTGYLAHVFWKDRNRMRLEVLNQTGENNLVDQEYRVLNSRGEIIWIHAKSREIGTYLDFPLYLIVLINITDRKMAQIAFEKEQKKYKIALESSADVLFEYINDTDTFYSYQNSRKQMKDNNTKSEKIEHYLENITSIYKMREADRKKIYNIMVGTSSQAEVQMCLPDSADFHWYFFQGDSIIENGTIQRIIGTYRNIDNIKKNEEKRNYLEGVCNFVISKEYQFLITVDIQSKQYHCGFQSNDTSCFIPADGDYELELPRIIGQFVLEEEQSQVMEGFRIEVVLKELLINKKEYNLYYRIRQAAGEMRWKCASFFYFGKQDKSILILVRDIQHIQDAKLKEEIANQSIEMVTSQIFDAIFYINLSKYKLEFIKSRKNEAEIKIFNNKKDDLSDFYFNIYPEDREEFRKKINISYLLDAFKKGEKSVYLESRRQNTDGRYQWFSINVIHMKDNLDGDIMAMGVVMDIEEQKQLEQEQREFTESFSSFYEECAIINLDKGSYHYKKMNQYEKEIPQMGVYEEEYEKYKNLFIYPADHKVFSENFSLNAIRTKLQTERKQYSKEVRRLFQDGSYRWIEMTILPIQNCIDNDSKVICIYRDIHELKNARSEQKKSNQRFVSAVKNLYNNIFEGDFINNRIYHWTHYQNSIKSMKENLPLDEYLLYIEKNIIHQDYQYLYHNLFSFSQLMKAFDSGQQEVYFEAPRLIENRGYRWYSMQAQLLLRDTSNYRVMFYLKDMDDTKKEEERKRHALLDALAIAEQANHAKSDFLSRMSHDIRTPMNAIIGMTTIAESNLYDAVKIEDCLKKISISAKYLLSLINDILDMSKIESGKMTLHKKVFNLHEFIQDITTLIYPQALEKKLEFKVFVDDNLELSYKGDTLRLNQILMNLLGNSIKYTEPDGKVMLRVKKAKEKAQKTMLQFEIEDNGIGISEEFLEKLFEPFEQADKKQGRVFEGSGLGLSITKNLVHIMHGQISVNSKLGKGTVFTVILPLERTKHDKIEIREEIPLDMNLLMIDKDTDFCEKTKKLLLKIGISADCVNTINSGIESMEQAVMQKHPYDIIMLDSEIAVFNGMSSAKLIKQVKGASKIPLIMTAYDCSKIEQEEVDFLLPKPVFEENIKEVLSKILYFKDKNEIMEADKIFFNGENVLLVEDNEINMEVAKTLLEMKGLNIDIAENGRIAVEKFLEKPCGYYKIILMDIRMPEMDGLEATKKIRSSSKLDSLSVPIIAMTANAFQEEMEYSRRIGMNDYITKPIDTEILFTKLYKYINKKNPL